MADREILRMAAAAFAQRLDVLQRGIHPRHVLAAHPARHLAMQLPGYGFVDLVAGEAQAAHNQTPLRGISMVCDDGPPSTKAPSTRLRIEMKMLAKNAVQKPDTLKPLTSQATS